MAKTLDCHSGRCNYPMWITHSLGVPVGVLGNYSFSLYLTSHLCSDGNRTSLHLKRIWNSGWHFRDDQIFKVTGHKHKHIYTATCLYYPVITPTTILAQTIDSGRKIIQLKTAICQTANPVNNNQKKIAKGLVYSRQYLKLKNNQETKETETELTIINKLMPYISWKPFFLRFTVAYVYNSLFVDKPWIFKHWNDFQII